MREGRARRWERERAKAGEGEGARVCQWAGVRGRDAAWEGCGGQGDSDVVDSEVVDSEVVDSEVVDSEGPSRQGRAARVEAAEAAEVSECVSVGTGRRAARRSGAAALIHTWGPR